MITSSHRGAGLVTFMIFLAQFSIGQSQYRFQHFDSKDGLADNFVFSISQDSLGYMWFQYYSGLTRYDGYNFKIYNHDKDDPRTSGLDFGLGRLTKDANGNVWIQKHPHPQRPPFIIAKINSRSDGFTKYTTDLGKTVVGPVCVDSTTIWLGTFWGRGLLNYNTETGDTIYYLNRVGRGDVAQNSIFHIKDLGSSLLLLTSRGLWNFDKITKDFSRPTCDPKDSTFLYNTWFIHLIQKSKNSFWMVESTYAMDSRPTGFSHLRTDLSVIQRNSFPSGFPLSSMDIDDEGIVWMGTWNSGLYRFDPSDTSFINIRNVPSDPNSLKADGVGGVFVDRDQNVWVAGAKGVSKMYRQTLRAVNYQEGGVVGLFNAKGKDFIIRSKETAGSPLNSFEIKMAPVSFDQFEPSQFRALPGTMDAIAITKCHQGKKYFWVRAYPTGVFGYPINPETGMPDKQSVHYYSDPSNPNTISVGGISTVWEDPEENLWVSGVGLHKVNPRVPYGESGSVATYKHIDSDTNSISGDLIFHIYPENETSFWLLTENGLDLYHRESGKFEHVLKARSFVSTMSRVSDGTLFLGTAKGLYEGKKKFGRYSFDDAPLWSGGDVRAIQEDRLGRLWLLTSHGLVCFDRKEKIWIGYNDDDNVNHVYSLDNHRLHKTSEGTMVAVSDDGVTFFDPLSLTIQRMSTKPMITRLDVNNKEAVVQRPKGGDDDFAMAASISVLKELTIDHEHNNFSIGFSAMEMTAPEKNLFRHKLEGFDNDWIETDVKNRTATYTNLDAGEYTFRVKASNHHGIWSDVETTLKIKVLPPPWKSTWAYTGYGILFIGLLYVARMSIVQRERLKSNLKLAKVEQEKEHFELEKAKEVDKVKSTFFANISHEFRTPLTLIKGPVQELLEEFTDHPKVKDRLKLVQRNADLVLKLINQLLDLAKLESGTLTVEKSESDLNAFLGVVTNSFSSLAFQKNISLKSELPQQRNLVSFDKGKVETILINLINNAIKFTPPGGSVVVRTELKSLQANNESDSAGTPLWRRGVGGEVTITVSDTGIGIDKDQHEKIFERFHQVSEAHKEVGTGIGLSLVKELVALMKGTLSLKSDPGLGSEFTVTLPVEVIRLLTETEEVRKVEEQQLPAEFTLKTNGHESHDNKPRILVVEDNSDLRKFIIGSLGNEFHFLEAADGKQGLEIAFEETPDLIISDVMMPEMDGITMTGKIKSDTRTSHIPLILLTAKTSDESKLTGLGTGADDYLTKPFNKNELLLKVRNSIALRVKLREKIKLELLKESPNVEVQSADEKFLLKVREAILSRLSDEQLSVESLADEIGLSRSQLFRKISALTGASVNELIRTFRLQKAAQLLEQNWAPVTQVAYEVGYSNLSYFSKAFKEKYGVSPSEYPVKTN